MKTTQAILIALGISLAATVSVASGRPDLADFGNQREWATEAACIVTGTASIPVTLELAITISERRQGLQGRKHMAANQGMLFIFRQNRSPDATFWMHKTLLPLDIAYLGPKGTIRSILQMQPCSGRSSECPQYPAGVPHLYALEMNHGFFARQGVKVGDKLIRGHCKESPWL